MEYLTFYLPVGFFFFFVLGLGFFLVMLLSFCGKKKSLIYSQSGEKNIPQNPLQSHIFHMCEVQCSSLFAKLCFLVGLDTPLLLLLSITGCFSLTYSPL